MQVERVSGLCLPPQLRALLLIRDGQRPEAARMHQAFGGARLLSLVEILDASLQLPPDIPAEQPLCPVSAPLGPHQFFLDMHSQVVMVGVASVRGGTSLCDLSFVSWCAGGGCVPEAFPAQREPVRLDAPGVGHQVTAHGMYAERKKQTCSSYCERTQHRML